jgi:hypothetical protein
VLYDYLSEGKVREILRVQSEGGADYSHQIWLLLTLAIWLESLKGPLPPTLAA